MSHASLKKTGSLSKRQRNRQFALKKMSVEPLEQRQLLAADLGIAQATQIEMVEDDALPMIPTFSSGNLGGISFKSLGTDSTPADPFYYFADGRRIELLPIDDAFMVGVKPGRDVSLDAIFSDPSSPQPWSAQPNAVGERMFRVEGVTEDWLRSSLAGLDADAGLSATWIAPAVTNMEAGVRQWMTDEVIIALNAGVEAEEFFSDPMFAGYRSLRGTNDQFVATLANGGGIEALEIAENQLPLREGVAWSTMNFVEDAIADFIPNDPLFSLQWGHRNVAQTGGFNDADIDSDLAWDTVTGDVGVIVAIVDDGVQTNHPDLSMWSNPNDNSSNGLDDDANGWIDDINGLNLVDAAGPTDNPNSNNPNPANSFDNHGTAVAGAAAAAGNNSLGVAGSAYGTRIMGLKPFSNNGNGTASTSTDSVIETIYYAAGRTADGNGTWRGADVINISYSMGASTARTAAFDWAVANGRNGLGTPVFASTGNSASAWETFSTTINIPLALDEGAEIELRYKKDGSVSSGADTVWISNVRIPGLGTQRFDGTFEGWIRPNGATNPGWILEENDARQYGTQGTAIRPADIGDNQVAYMRSPEFETSGTFSFNYWISSEENFDGLEVWVRTRDFFGSFGSFTQIGGLISGIAENADDDGNGVPDLRANASYPANLNSTIGVGASTDFDYRADYSQYGPGLDFVAPSGGGFRGFDTTDRTGSAGYSGSDYAVVAGTSFSSPMAAGVGALMLSRNAELSAAQIKSLMQSTAEQVAGVSYPGGVNTFYGHGRINANAAVNAAGNDSNDTINEASIVSLGSSTNGRIGNTRDVDMYRIIVSAGQRVGIDLDNQPGELGTDTFLRLFDAAGNQLDFDDDTDGPLPEVDNQESYLEYTFTTAGSYYIGVSAFNNSSYNANDGSGDSAALPSRIGNYALNVNNLNTQSLTVVETDDSGDGFAYNGVTLREAIEFANLNPNSDTITFDPTVFSTPQVITLGGTQLTLSTPIIIDGPGADILTIDANDGSRVFLVDDGVSGGFQNVQLRGMTIAGGNAGEGGGVFNRENLTIADSVITGNRSTGLGGGGIYANRGELLMIDSALTNNTAVRGGGLFVRNVSADATTLRNSTVSGNSASVGGGIENYFDTLSIENSTVTDNQAANGAGVRTWGTAGYAATFVQNSIIAGNDGPDIQVNGTPNNFTSQGYNIIGSGNAIGRFTQPGDRVGIAPQLGSLADHGGTTPSHALLPGSPAINGGNPATTGGTDQIGNPRIVGGVVDIGAIEANPPVVRTLQTITGNTIVSAYDLRATEVVFYSFTIDTDVTVANNFRLIIDTLGSTLSTSNDTELGLYNEQGNRVALNDDYDPFAGSDNLLSRLSFGVNGDDGELPSGNYFLAISGFNTTHGSSDFAVASTSNNVGNVFVNFTFGELPSLTCDFSGDGACDIADLNLLYPEFGGSNPLFNLDGNGIVDNADLTEWLTQASAADPRGFTLVRGDANLDGIVGGADFTALASNFGSAGGWAEGNFVVDPVAGGGTIGGADFTALASSFGFESLGLNSLLPSESGRDVHRDRLTSTDKLVLDVDYQASLPEAPGVQATASVRELARPDIMLSDDRGDAEGEGEGEIVDQLFAQWSPAM